MGLVDRAKNILLKPKEEWLVIAAETPDTQAILVGYVLPLAVLAAIGTFVSIAFIGAIVGGAVAGAAGAALGVGAAVMAAIQTLVGAFIGVLVGAAVIDALAPSFNSEKDFGRSVQLVAYSMTAAWVGSIAMIIPFLGWIVAIAGMIYSIYLFYIGIGPMKKTPEDKRIVYIVVIVVVSILVNFLISMIFSAFTPSV